MTNPNRVEIIFVLDETGSMHKVWDDTIGGYNQFVQQQRSVNKDVRFTLVLFSKVPGEPTFRTRYQDVPIPSVEDLNNYMPRGTTPLLDAIGGTIDSVGARLAGMPEHERPGQVICVVLTDGQENASVEYTKAQVREMVNRQREGYNWEFVFLGANMDAIAEADAIGISPQYASNYAATPDGTARAFGCAAQTVSSLAAGEGRTDDIQQ
jgi:hypothetical protein